MRADVAMGTLVFVIGCGGSVEPEPLTTRDDAVGDTTPDASAPCAPALAVADRGRGRRREPTSARAGSTLRSSTQALRGTPCTQTRSWAIPWRAASPSICSMAPAPQALCDHLCGPGAVDCYYSTEPLDVNCAVSNHRLVNEWDAGYPCLQ